MSIKYTYVITIELTLERILNTTTYMASTYMICIVYMHLSISM